MKRFSTICLVVAACLFRTTALAQSASLPLEEEDSLELEAFDANNGEPEIWAGMPYRQIKKIYDYQDWQKAENDPYSPVAAGLCSLFIPGLGQMINGEFGIGLAYLGGVYVSELSAVFFTMAALSAGNVDDEFRAFGTIGAAVALAASVTLNVCSIMGAYRMAARKNLLYQDLHSSDISFTSGITMIPNGDGRSFTPGLSLRVNF